MNTYKKGDDFERWVYEALSAQVAKGGFGVRPENVTLFHKRPYFSSSRGANIIFDIALEVTLDGAPHPSIYWIWECKNYSGSVPVSDIEEFYAKVQQVTGLNVKAGFATNAPLQEAALSFAKSKGIAVVRVLHDGLIRKRPPDPPHLMHVSYCIRIPTLEERLGYRERDLCSPELWSYGQRVFGYLPPFGLADDISGLLKAAIHPPTNEPDPLGRFLADFDLS